MRRQASPEHLREDDGVIVVGVVGGVDEGERSLPRLASQCREPRTLAAELLDIASAELRESFRLVPEPLPELWARGRSFSQPSSLARWRETPRGQSRSISTRWPSAGVAGSYARFRRTSVRHRSRCLAARRRA